MIRHLFIFLFFYTHFVICAIITHISFESIPFHRFELVKISKFIDNAEEANIRKVYWDPDHGHYYKVWNKNFRDTEKFITALRRGFYKDISPLTGVLWDKDNECRGYVCAEVDTNVSDLTIEHDEEGKTRIAPLNKQKSNAYKKFFALIFEKMLNTNLIHRDLTPTNLGKIDGQYVFIDLEEINSVMSIEHDSFFQQKVVPKDYILLAHMVKNLKYWHSKNWRDSQIKNCTA
jgi:hypothetical protein